MLGFSLKKPKPSPVSSRSTSSSGSSSVILTSSTNTPDLVNNNLTTLNHPRVPPFFKLNPNQNLNSNNSNTDGFDENVKSVNITPRSRDINNKLENMSTSSASATATFVDLELSPPPSLTIHDNISAGN